ncbi:hypothetical protein EZS27_026482 [termite gut metagenome]|uniref:Uncharacterized protein n=1 Tax=termite gut metagenome TaxID=433724 RepID=A0A5J4QS66_9ZZZZ
MENTKHHLSLYRGEKKISGFMAIDRRRVLLSMFKLISEKNYSNAQIKHLSFTITGESERFLVIPELFVKLKTNKITSEELLMQSVLPGNVED